MADQEAMKSVRKNVVALLEALAGGGTTRSLGRSTPYLDSLAELRTMWFDDLYPEKFVIDGVFSKDEALAVAPLSQALRDLHAASLGNDINAFHEHPLWKKIISCAQKARAKLAA